MAGICILSRRGGLVRDRGDLLPELFFVNDVGVIRSRAVRGQCVIVVEVERRVELDGREGRFWGSARGYEQRVTIQKRRVEHVPWETAAERCARVRQLLPENLHADPPDGVLVVLQCFLAEAEEQEEDKR